MKPKSALLAGALLFFTGGVLVPAQDGFPKVRISDYAFDVGVMMQGESVEKRIQVFNEGDADLVIHRITPGCSCTTIHSFDETVKPGEQGEIHLTIDSKKIRPGKTLKKFRIATNDPQAEMIVVEFTGEVRVMVETKPHQIVLRGLFGREKETVVELRAATRTPFELLDVKVRDGRAQVVATETIEPGRHYRVRLKAGTAPEAGTVKDALDMTVKIDGNTFTTSRWVTVTHLEAIVLQPAGRLMFNNKDTNKLLVENAKPIQKYVNVMSASPDISFKIKEVILEEIPEDAVDLKTITVREGHAYRVILSIPAYRKETFLQGKLKIVTDLEDGLTQELLIFAKFGRRR